MNITSMIICLSLSMLHAGYYENPEEMNSSKGKSWQQAQFDHIDAMLKVAGVKKADQVRLTHV